MADFARIADLADLPPALRGGVVAIGNFDGVHRGHQAVLARARSEARALGAPVLVLTFEPHPRQFFRPDLPLFRLTPPGMKARLVAAMDFDAVVELPFTASFAAQSAEAFVDRILVEGLGIRHAVTGFDFHFGKDRQGGPAFLIEAGRARGFEVSLIDAFRDEGTEVISSSRIRQLLCEGDVAQSAGLLGYRYTVDGVVSRGRQLGRTLGYPTANMALADTNGLKHGIYAVRLRDGSGTLRDGVASFGRRPTVDEAGAPLLETYVFDYSGDLYGQACAVSFFGFLRSEEKFASLDDLVVQMKRDEAEARALLADMRPLGPLDATLAF
jgi:riboflavin kinase/FMN adenylyltransferase